MPKYFYTTIISKIEEGYKRNTSFDIYDHFGQVDFSKAYLVVEAENELESENIRKGITDIRMWELDRIED